MKMADQSAAVSDGDEKQAIPVAGAAESLELESSVEIAVAEKICEDLLTQLCIEVACEGHRMAKTGILPLSNIMDPSGSLSAVSTLPDYEDSAAGTSGGTSSNDKSRRRSSSFLPSDDEFGIGAQVTKRPRSNTLNSISENAAAATTETGDVPMVDAATEPPAGCDVWGSKVPKEPKQTAKCDICGRHVSALRFAPHLDKCMNLGNSRSAGSRRS